MPNPAYRIETERLVIRCWNPVDAPLLKEAIDSSLDELREWMPWAHDEPSSVEELIERLREFRGAFDCDDDYIYGVFDPGEMKVLGGTGLHPRIGPHGREIGYWIHADHHGRGYATEAAAALVRTGFEHEELDRIEIRCAPDNHASARIPEKLGFTHEATLRRRLEEPDGNLRDTEVFTLFADAYPDSPATEYDVNLYDVRGHEI